MGSKNDDVTIKCECGTENKVPRELAEAAINMPLVCPKCRKPGGMSIVELQKPNQEDV